MQFVTDWDYTALARGAYGLYQTDGANIPHKMYTASPSAPIS